MTTIRAVTPADAPSLCGIYNFYILNSAVTFAETPMTVPEWEAKIARLTAENHPFLCACDDTTGEVVGYAHLSRFRSASAYRLAESSIYLTPGNRGQGVGGELYRALIAEARRSGNYSGIVAVITSGNTGSLEFHRKLGFEHCGSIPNSGNKGGAWYGIEFMVLPLRRR